MWRIIIRSAMYAPDSPEKTRNAAVDASHQVRSPRNPLPEIRFPEELPVSARREEIAAALAKHQVIIVVARRAQARPRNCPSCV